MFRVALTQRQESQIGSNSELSISYTYNFESLGAKVFIYTNKAYIVINSNKASSNYTIFEVINSNLIKTSNIGIGLVFRG